MSQTVRTGINPIFHWKQEKKMFVQEYGCDLDRKDYIEVINTFL